MAENKLSLEELYAQQQKVAEAERVAKDTLAKQSAERQKQSIAQQLAKQRQDYLSSRQQVSEQSYLQSKALASQLANRGLGYGGTQQLGQLQNKIVAGKTLSELAKTNKDVVEAGLLAGTQTEQNLQNALQQSSLDYQKSITEGNLQKELLQYERDKEAQNLRLQLGQTLLEAQMSGASDEQLQNLKELYVGAGGSQEEFDSLLNNLAPVIDEETGEVTYDSRASWGKTAALTGSMAAGAGLGTLIAPGIGTAVGAVGGGLAGILGVNIAGNDEGQLIYNLPGLGKQTFTNKQDAEKAIMNIYKDRTYFNNIKAQVQNNGSILFITPDNRSFDTYNKAETWVKSQGIIGTTNNTQLEKNETNTGSFRGR